jgi:hypothetical protein
VLLAVVVGIASVLWVSVGLLGPVFDVLAIV